MHKSTFFIESGNTIGRLRLLRLLLAAVDGHGPVSAAAQEAPQAPAPPLESVETVLA
jgi:hypothetical protein